MLKTFKYKINRLFTVMILYRNMKWLQVIETQSGRQYSGNAYLCRSDVFYTLINIF